jgi:hypothetical protein
VGREGSWSGSRLGRQKDRGGMVDDGIGIGIGMLARWSLSSEHGYLAGSSGNG